MKLLVRLVGFSVFLFLIGLITSSFFIYLNGRKAMTNNTLAHLTSVALLKEDQLNVFMKERKDDLVQLAIHITEEHETIEKQTNMDVDLQFYLKQHPYFTSLFIQSLEGTVLSSSIPEEKGKIRYITGNSFTNSDVFVENFIFSPLTLEPASYVYMLIRDPLGQPVSILGGTIQLERISELMTERTGLGETEETYLLNKNNYLVTPSRFIPNIEYTKTMYTQAARECFINKTGTGLYPDYRNIPVLGSYRYAEEANVCVIAEIDQQEAYLPVNQILLTIIITTAMLVLISSVVAFAVIGRIISPLIDLKKAAITIGQGNLFVKLPKARNDEIGELTNAFDSMAKNINSYQERLTETIAMTKAEKDKVLAIIQSIGDGVFVLDENKKIILVNEITCSISGFSADELLNTSYNTHLQFTFEKDGTPNTSFIEQVYSDKKLSSMANHTQLKRKDGSFVPVADSASPILDDEGYIKGCVVVFRDVTRERQIEQMKDDFISLASHQLRTPLTAIRWITDRLSKATVGPLNDKQKDLLGDVHESTTRLISLVNDLLNISRIESGRLIVEPTPTKMKELIKTTIEELTHSWTEKNIHLSLEIPDTIQDISIDPKLIRQALLNIVNNAIKYTKQDGTIKIDVRVVSKNLLISVTDSGIGIPQSEQAKLFGRFFRASNTAGADYDGTGLGLYLVKKIMDASGGTVLFSSEEKKGTVFTLYIPLTGSIEHKGEVHLS